MLFVRSSIGCLTALALFGSWTTPAFANNDEDPFAPESEQASSPPESGPELGLRLGLTNASGAFESGNPVGNSVAGMLPLWVDAGYRVYDRWFLGFYWQYALGIRSSTSSTECEDCVHSGIHYGLQVNYSVLRGKRAHIWVGLGFGHQSFETVDEVTKQGTAYEGWEPLSVHLGSAWRPTLGVEIGPYFSMTYSTISSRNRVCYAPDRSGCPPVERTSLPEGETIWWNTVGVRASFLP